MENGEFGVYTPQSRLTTPWSPVSGVNLPPSDPLPTAVEPPSADVDPDDVGTVRNWSPDLGAIPPDANLEPVALIGHLPASDPITANRLRDALERFPPVGSPFAGFDLVAVLGRGTFGRV